MEAVIGAIVLASFILNVFTYLDLRSQLTDVSLTVEPKEVSLTVETIESQRALVVCNCCCGEPQEAEALPAAMITVGPDRTAGSSPAPLSGTHQAWVNQKDIPLTETVYHPSAPVPVRTPGPLERPGGFAL